MGNSNLEVFIESSDAGGGDEVFDDYGKWDFLTGDGQLFMVEAVRGWVWFAISMWF